MSAARQTPLDRLRHHVTGAIERGEAGAIEGVADLSHLNALQCRLSRSRIALSEAKTDSERAIRTCWLNQCEKEVAGEMAFLGIVATELPETTIDELFNELQS